MLLMAAVREELGDLAGEVCGVGTVMAAVRAAAVIERVRPTAVCLIGTGSALPGGPAIGSIVTGRQIGLSTGVAAMGLGYVPRIPRPVSCSPHLLQALNLPQVDIATSGAVTTDDTLGQRLSDEWQVEHLEAFGVALACHEAGVPFAMVLGIATQAGPDAHSQWLTNRSGVQDAVRAVVRRLGEPTP